MMKVDVGNRWRITSPNEFREVGVIKAQRGKHFQKGWEGKIKMRKEKY